MKLWLFGSAVRSAAPPRPEGTRLPDLGPAPDLKGVCWLNTPGPLHPADLRGKVLLVTMWTFGCINCQHVIPSLRAWHHTYADQGLVVIGNHYPEFDFERKLANLKQAVVDLDVSFAVLQDNQGINWRAFRSRAWPSLFLVDRKGRIRYLHVGEGAYAQTEAAIQTLLSEPAQPS